jgi:hypothetical protein
MSGNYPKGGLTQRFLKRATLGMLYSKLAELDDIVINPDSLKEKVKDFKRVRNEFVHEIISSGKDYEEIEKVCERYIKVADVLLQETWYKLAWVEDALTGF